MLSLAVSSNVQLVGRSKSSLNKTLPTPGRSSTVGDGIGVGIGVGVSVAGNHTTVAVGTCVEVGVAVGKGVSVSVVKQPPRNMAHRQIKKYRNFILWIVSWILT